MWKKRNIGEMEYLPLEEKSDGEKTMDWIVKFCWLVAGLTFIFFISFLYYQFNQFKDIIIDFEEKNMVIENVNEIKINN